MWGEPPLTLFIFLHLIPFLIILFAVPSVPHNVKPNFTNCFAKSTPSFLCLSFKEINASPLVGREFCEAIWLLAYAKSQMASQNSLPTKGMAFIL